MVAILSKFTVLCPSSYFVVYFLKLKLKLILSYNRVIDYYDRIFLILLLHLVSQSIQTYLSINLAIYFSLFVIVRKLVGCHLIPFGDRS